MKTHNEEHELLNLVRTTYRDEFNTYWHATVKPHLTHCGCQTNDAAEAQKEACWRSWLIDEMIDMHERQAAAHDALAEEGLRVIDEREKVEGEQQSFTE